ncbi:hypothetical protein QBC40DRAFT_299091 [Triangularia verruculosa]|uniref:Pre-mRNA splicing factor CLF1 n=1 Tax=Triangularia verruculosa TaxID=2587418 RepID=A0AAN7AUB2_9PEZI|nr:hypothetical protein QBC40DRAFT_299091 [Triangularia verruculosa]
MSLPQPETPLNNACSVIFDHTLYTYSADAFQSLKLEPGAEWEVLPQGEKVTGGACVGSTTGNPATSALFVVGGKGGSADYQGLQKYTFSTGQWEAVPVDTRDISGRIGHSAVYLNSTDSILVYGGGSEGQASSQTFTVGAAAPHNIRSYESWAPPAVKPILLPWSTHEAVMLGGNAGNAQVYLFNNQDGKWTDSGATLATPLAKDSSALQAVLMSGADGSKNLLTFDMSESPNVVRRTVLFTGPGQPVPAAAPVTKRSTRRRARSADKQQRRRDDPLTLNNWPAYNSSLAPTTTRSNFALAQDIDGMVVIAGGNDKEPIAMFDTTTNTWQNATDMIGQVRLLSLDDESSTTVSSTATTSTTATATSSTLATTTSDGVGAATATPTETAEPVAAGGSKPNINTILGAVLGSVFGLALILGLIYFCLRRRTKKQAHTEAGHIRRSSGASSNEKEGLGYAKDTHVYGQGPQGTFRGHQSQDSKSSFSSMAILMGRTSESKPRLPAISHKASKRESGDSVFRAFKSTISKPILPETQQPMGLIGDEKGVAFSGETVEPRPRNLTTADKRESTRRSSGWNRYWSGGSALNMLGFGSGNSNTKNNSERTTLHSDRSSKYSDQPNRITQDSVTVPRLQINEPRLSFSRVNSHSPTIATYHNAKFNEGMSAQIETGRPVSAVSDMSMSAYSSGIPESVHDAWDPTASNTRPWGMERQNSSNTGIYATALAPVPATRPSAEPAPLRKQPSAVRDDMSWLNLG